MANSEVYMILTGQLTAYTVNFGHTLVLGISWTSLWSHVIAFFGLSA